MGFLNLSKCFVRNEVRNVIHNKVIFSPLQNRFNADEGETKKQQDNLRSNGIQIPLKMSLISIEIIKPLWNGHII